MSDPARWQASAPCGRDAARLRPAGMAILLHGALLALALAAIRIAPPAPPEPAVSLVIETLQPLAASAIPAAPPAAPSLSRVPSMVVAAAPQPAAVRPMHFHPAAPRAQATQFTSTERLASPAPVPQKAAGRPTPPPANDPTGAALAGLEARIDAAVRAAAAMPDAARRQHREGSARLRFSYLDGVVDGVQLVASSQSRLLDDAALLAVRRAHYPMPPAGVRGRRLDLLVWVDFRLAPGPG